jgi:hypothetical protein
MKWQQQAVLINFLHSFSQVYDKIYVQVKCQSNYDKLSIQQADQILTP